MRSRVDFGIEISSEIRINGKCIFIAKHYMPMPQPIDLVYVLRFSHSSKESFVDLFILLTVLLVQPNKFFYILLESRRFSVQSEERI
jgi:hypothetical protein